MNTPNAIALLSLIIGFVLGWTVRAALDAAMLKIGTRIIASAWGKKAALEMLAKGIEKLGDQP